MTRCYVCGRFRLKPCRTSRFCMAWAKAHEKAEAMMFVSDGSTQYSKAAGKFVVPWF